MSKQLNVDVDSKQQKGAKKKPDAEMTEEQKLKAQQKAERKAAFEAQRKVIEEKKSEESGKSKAQLKAERRAKQETQRAAKAGNTLANVENTLPKKAENTLAKKTESNLTKKREDAHTNAVTINSFSNQINNNKTETDIKSQNDVKQDKNELSERKTPEKVIEKPKSLAKSAFVMKAQIFTHLPQRHNMDDFRFEETPIHPFVVKVGLRINKGIIKGSNPRCVAMLIAFKKVITDYVTPPTKELTRDLEATLEVYAKFIAKCRPLSISMLNAIKFLKLTFSRIQTCKSDDMTAKHDLCNSIDCFISDEIMWAQRGVTENANNKVNYDNDVILTFGYSLIVKHVLYKAIKMGKKFRVVVVDSRPRFDGRELLKFLLEHNIPATYIFINAISYVMKEVTKVLLGAHSLLANGYVMSHLGSSQIALVAHAYNIPVLVCCETYKFSERVHTDSFVYNELGNSEAFLNSVPTKGQLQQSTKDLNILDLLYDVTPHEFVSVVITEKGILPCTSVPAVLRVRETK